MLDATGFLEVLRRGLGPGRSPKESSVSVPSSNHQSLKPPQPPQPWHLSRPAVRRLPGELAAHCVSRGYSRSPGRSRPLSCGKVWFLLRILASRASLHVPRKGRGPPCSSELTGAFPGEHLAGHADTSSPADLEPLPPTAFTMHDTCRVANGLALDSFGKGQFNLGGRFGWGW